MNPNNEIIKKLSVDAETLVKISALDERTRLMWFDGLCAIAAGRESEFVFADPNPLAQTFWREFAEKTIKARDNYKKTCQKARESIKTRWAKNAKGGNNQSQSFEKPPQTPNDTSGAPEKKTVKKLQTQNDKRLEEFANAIYQIYPRKTARKDAVKAILKVLTEFNKAKRPITELYEKTRAYTNAVQSWSDSEKKYIPYPATWFNKGCYDDDPESWQKTDDNGRIKPVYTDNNGNF